MIPICDILSKRDTPKRRRCWYLYTIMGAGAATDTTPPTITSSNTGSVNENTTLAFSLTASESVTWSIVGGADQAQFEISGSTLRWLGNGTKDFEAPNDANLDNAYVVIVRATDASSNTTDQTITVTVTNVVEVVPNKRNVILVMRAG